jgi:glycosyltransferase involved in cell wall biosynthesis
VAAGDPLRVLRVIARLNVGGPALHVSYLTHGLERFGYETLLVTGRVGAGEGSMEYAARELGIEPVFVDALGREISPGRDLVAVLALRDAILRLRPHVLHTHTAKAGAIGRLAASLAGAARPLVVVHTFHGHVLRGYFGPRTTESFRRVEQGLARVTDALVAVSPEVRDDLAELGIAPAEKIAVIRLGLDLEGRTTPARGARRRVRAELGIGAGVVNVAWFGRMTEIKRVDELLDAFARLRRAGGPPAVLTLVGDGPLRAGLEARAQALGIAGDCRFLGYVADVASLYAAADLVALSSANEGTPVSLIEALAAGRPVVSTAVGGVGDVVADGVTGLLAPPGDPGGLAARLALLAADPPLRRRLAEAGRAHVLERYSIPRLLGDVDALYRTLLDERDPAERRVLSPGVTPLAPALEPRRRGRADLSRRLRIVLVSQYFPPEIGATQTRMQAFAEHLAARGHRVTVVCEFPNHPHGVIPGRYRGRLLEDDRSNGYRVLRVWVRASAEKTQRTRIEFYASYMALATLVAPLAGRADVVLATSPPLFAGIAGATIARLERAPFVLDVRDLWPAAAVSLDQISERAAAVSALIERWLYREAAAVVAVTRPFCEHIDALRPRGPRTVLLPNGTLERFFTDGDRTARLALGVADGRFAVTFAGTHGIAQALPSVLEAAALERESDFVLIGDGPVKPALLADAEARGLENVRFCEPVPLTDVPPLLAASDALLVPLSGRGAFGAFVPSKLIDFMAAGRPVVLAAAGEAARIVEQAGAGVVVPPEDPAALAAAVRWLRANAGEAERMGERGRSYARTQLRSAQAERLEELLLDVVGRR